MGSAPFLEMKQKVLILCYEIESCQRASTVVKFFCVYCLSIFMSVKKEERGDASLERIKILFLPMRHFSKS